MTSPGTPTPLHPPLTFEESLALHQQGQLNAALAGYAQVLQHTPNHFDALNMSGAASYQLGQFHQAQNFLTQALQITPHSASAHTHLSLTLKSLGQLADATHHAQSAVQLAPELPQTHNNLGILWHESGALTQAIDCYQKALALDDYFAQAHFNLANAWHDSSHSHQALAHYQRATEIAPNYTQAFFNWGNALCKLKQYAQSLACYEKALSIAPNHTQALNNLGNALRELTHYAQAQQCYELALQVQSDYTEAEVNLAYVLLLTGQWQNGWRHYEKRWSLTKTGLAPREFSQPQWTGQSSLRGKTLLLHAEQGLGDTLQFCRLVEPLKRIGAKQIILEVQAPLVELIKSLKCVDQVIARGDTIPTFDVHCPLLSVPWGLLQSQASLDAPTLDALHLLPSTSAPTQAYLYADPQHTQKWRDWLASKHPAPNTLRIGLVFSGSTTHLHDQFRSMTLKELLTYLPTHQNGVEVQYVCLQNALRPHDLLTLQASRVLNVSDELQDFSDTAALCDALDLIISVDTSVAHLAGALNKPLYLLLPLVPDWRWGVSSPQTPWYPQARLYRQTIKDDWTHPLTQLQQDLQSNLLPPNLQRSA